MNDWHTRIVIAPNTLVGKPVVRGTRLSVEFIVELLAQGWTEAENPTQLSGIDVRGYSGLYDEFAKICIDAWKEPE